MTKSELKSIIKECVEEILNEEYYTYVNEGFFSNLIGKLKSKLSGLKKGKSSEEIAKEKELKSSVDLKQVDSIVKAGKKKAAKAIDEAASESTKALKVGRFNINVIGTDNSGNLIATCDTIKIKGAKVKLVGTSDFSLMNENVIDSIGYVSAMVDTNFANIISSIFKMYDNDPAYKGLSPKNINKVDWAQGKMHGDMIVSVEFGVTTNTGKKFGCYLDVDAYSDEKHIGAWEM